MGDGPSTGELDVADQDDGFDWARFKGDGSHFSVKKAFQDILHVLRQHRLRARRPKDVCRSRRVDLRDISLDVAVSFDTLEADLPWLSPTSASLHGVTDLERDQPNSGVWDGLQEDTTKFEDQMAALGKQRRWEDVFSTLTRACHSGVRPSAMMYQTLVGNCQDWSQSINILDQVFWRGPLTDRFIYASVMKACGAGKQWPRTMALISELCHRGLSWSGPFSVAIGACGQGSQWTRALSLLGDAQMRGVELRTKGFSACKKGSQWETALAIIVEMPRRAVETDRVYFEAAVAACTADHNAERGQKALDLSRKSLAAFGILDMSRQSSVELGPEAYAQVIRVSSRAFRWAIAATTMKTMQHDRWAPDVFQYAAVMQSNSQVRRWEATLDIFRQLSAASLEMSTVCAMEALVAYGIGHQWQQALSLLGELRASGLDLTKLVEDVAEMAVRPDGSGYIVPNAGSFRKGAAPDIAPRSSSSDSQASTVDVQKCSEVNAGEVDKVPAEINSELLRRRVHAIRSNMDEPIASQETRIANLILDEFADRIVAASAVREVSLSWQELEEDSGFSKSAFCSTSSTFTLYRVCCKRFHRGNWDPRRKTDAFLDLWAQICDDATEVDDISAESRLALLRRRVQEFRDNSVKSFFSREIHVAKAVLKEYADLIIAAGASRNDPLSRQQLEDKGFRTAEFSRSSRTFTLYEACCSIFHRGSLDPLHKTDAFLDLWPQICDVYVKD